MPIVLWVLLISELVAFMLTVRIWRSGEIIALKVLLSLVALIPALGPLLALWIIAFPNEAPEAIQNRGPRGNYYRDWSRVVGARSPIRRFRLWRAQAAIDEDSDP
jgi:hypothetical protein